MKTKITSAMINIILKIKNVVKIIFLDIFLTSKKNKISRKKTMLLQLFIMLNL